MLNDAPSKWITNRRALCKLQTALAASRRRRARSKMIMKDLFSPVNHFEFLLCVDGVIPKEAIFVHIPDTLLARNNS